MKGRVLVVAGSDSCGGAGIQADIKTITALGGYAATAVTAVTAQNTGGVFAVQDLPAEFVAQQMTLVLDDIGADVMKTGMLHRAELIQCVVEVGKRYSPEMKILVDPVMYAKGGAPLLEKSALRTLVSELVSIADLITPNLPEAGKILGSEVRSVDDMRIAVTDLLALGPKAVLLKGGHLAGKQITDFLATENGVEIFQSARVMTRHTHGTGCTLASAISVGIAQGLSIRSAVIRAREYVLGAIRTAPGYGGGHGPINHTYKLPT